MENKKTTFKGKTLSSGKILLSPNFEKSLFYGKVERSDKENMVRLVFTSKDLFDKTNAWSNVIPDELKSNVDELISKTFELGGTIESKNSVLIPVTEYAYKQLNRATVKDEIEQIIIQVVPIIEFTNKIF